MTDEASQLTMVEGYVGAVRDEPQLDLCFGESVWVMWTGFWLSLLPHIYLMNATLLRAFPSILF